MDDKTLYLLAAVIGPCPECGSGVLQAAFDGEQTNFVCARCGCCWHPELEWVNRVNPFTCPGCPARAICTQPRRPYGAPLASVGAGSVPADPRGA